MIDIEEVIKDIEQEALEQATRYQWEDDYTYSRKQALRYERMGQFK